jgi:hypothetical protein
MHTPLTPITPERSLDLTYSAFRVRLPDGFGASDAVIVWRSDEPEGAYYDDFPTSYVSDCALIGRVRRDATGTVVIGPARIVHHDFDDVLDPRWGDKFTADGLMQIWEAQALLPRLDRLYAIEGETVLRDPETGRPA